MQEVRYMISDTARKVDVEAHVLRYWEEELEIPIGRNEMGHRYYTSDDITLFQNIKVLKEQGFQLRAIKLLLPRLMESKGKELEKLFSLKEALNYQVSTMGQEVVSHEKPELKEEKPAVIESTSEVLTSEELHNEKVAQFENILRAAVLTALKDHSHVMEEQVTNKIIKHVDFMLREKEEQEEERFKKLDEAIRMKQRTRREIAASRELEKKEKRFARRRKKNEKKEKNQENIKEEDV